MRLFSRIPTSIPVLILAPGGLIFRGTATAVSGNGVAVETNGFFPSNGTVQIKFQGGAKFQGFVTRELPNGFAITFDTPYKVQERIALKLNNNAHETDEITTLKHVDRYEDRYRCKDFDVLLMVDSKPSPGRILNISRTGAAIVCPKVMEPGYRIEYDHHAGTIVRTDYLLNGVRFDRPLSAKELEEFRRLQDPKSEKPVSHLRLLDSK